MAETCDSSSLTSPKAISKKPVVVRVKRKANQERLDAFWLEINERPAKRALLDFESLSISDSSDKVIEESGTKKLLVQHVETLSQTGAFKDVLQTYLPDLGGSKDFKSKIEKRRSLFKQDKQKQEKLRSVARQKHEDLVKSARFEQIWKKRRGTMEADDDSLREICHLYDVVRVDDDVKCSRKVEEPEHVSVEDNAILCNYLPLLREHLPSAAEQIESDMASCTFKEDDYVYDLYTVEEGMDWNNEDDSTQYPLVTVNDADDDWNDCPASDDDSDDSNAENNERNDYPDEESSGGEDNEDTDEESSGSKDDEDIDPFYDLQGSDSEYEREVVEIPQSDDNWRWVHRDAY